MVRAAQRVEQCFLVGLARALPGPVARFEFGAELGRLEAVVQQALVGQLVDHPRVAHQVARRPDRQPDHPQQPVLHLGPLGEQRKVRLAAKQRLDPVEEAQCRVHAAAALHDCRGRAFDQPAEPLPAFVAQRQHAGLLGPAGNAGGNLARQPLGEGFAAEGRRRATATAASGSRGCTAIVVGCGSGAGGARLAFVQQGVELVGDEFADLAEALEQLACAGGGVGREAVRDPAQIGVGSRQQMRLLVVQKLDAVLDPTQEQIRLGQPCGGFRRHQPTGGKATQRRQRRAAANLGELPATHDQQQLHDEFDLADAAARELDVVGPLGPARGAALRLVADLAVQLPQRLEDAVVEVAPVDERRHDLAQRHGMAAFQAAARRDDAAFQPGKALPLAALHLQVVLEHRKADRRGAAAAVGPQHQVDAEDEAILGGVADQRLQAARQLGEVLLRTQGLRAVAVAVFRIDIHQVDVRRDVQLAAAELAHADDPELDRLARGVAQRAVARIELGTGAPYRQVERGLGQLGHGQCDVGHRRRLLDVEHRQPLEHQLPGHPQGAGERPAILLQARNQPGDDVAPRQSLRQQRQELGVAAADALHEAAVRGVGALQRRLAGGRSGIDRRSPGYARRLDRQRHRRRCPPGLA